MLQKLSQNLLIIATFLIPFYFWRFSILSIPTNIFEITVLVSLTCFIVSRSTLHAPRSTFGPLWPYLFLLAAFVAVFFSPDKTQALGIFKGWFAVPAVYYWLIINAFDQSKIAKLAASLSASALIISIWAILQKADWLGLVFYQRDDPASFDPYLAQGRAFGPFESPNYLAMFLVPAILLLVFLPAKKSKALSWLLGLSGILAALALYFSASLGGIAAFTLLVVLSFFRSRMAREGKSIRIGLSIFFLLIIVLAGLPIIKNELLADHLRVEIYRYSWQMLKADWLQGIGLGQFWDTIKILSAQNLSFQADGLPFALHPHNLFLAVWLNLGLAGFVFFLILLFSFFRRILKNSNYGLFFIGLPMLAILIHGLFDTTYFKNDLAAIFWLIYALAYLPKSGQSEVR